MKTKVTKSALAPVETHIPPMDMELHAVTGHHRGDELIHIHVRDHSELAQKLENLAEMLGGVHNKDGDQSAEIFILRRRKHD